MPRKSTIKAAGKIAAKITTLPFALAILPQEGGEQEEVICEAKYLEGYLGHTPEMPLDAAEFIASHEACGDAVLWLKDSSGAVLYHRDFPAGLPSFPELAELIDDLVAEMSPDVSLPELRLRAAQVMRLLRGSP